MNKGHRGQHNYYPQQPLPDIVHFPGAPGAQPNQSALTGHGLQAMQSMQAPQQMQQVNAVHTQHPRFQTTHAGNRRHNSPALMPPRQANIVQHQPAITSQANQVASGYQINQMMPPMIGRQPYNNAQYFVVQHPIQTTGPYYPFINQAAFVGMHQPPQNVQVRSTGPSSLMTQHGSNMSISQPSGSYPSSSETPTQSNENMVSYQPQQRPPEPKRERKGAVIQDPNSGHVFTEQELKSTEPVRQEAVLSEPQADASSSRNTPSNQSVISSSEAALEFRDKVSAAAASGTSQAGRSAAVEDHPPLVNSDECKTVTNVLDNSKINETPPDIGVSSAILNEDRVNEVEQISEETLNCVDDVKEPSPVLHQTDSTEEDSVNYHNEASTSDLVDNLRTVQETPKTESESEDTTKSDITNMTISNEQNGEVVDSVANVPPLVTPESNFKEEQITSKDKEEVAVDANKSEEINLSNEEKPSLVDEQTESGGKSESAENPSLPVPSPVLETNHAENELKDNVSSAGVQQNEKAKPEVLKVDASSQLNKNELSDKKGKYAYDPAFLKSLQNHPASMKKPDTLPKLDIIHDMPIPLRHTEPSDRYNRHSNAGVVDFLPHYMNVPPGRNPSRSSSQRGDRSGRGSQPNRPIKIISPSLTQDVKLHTVDNAWKPQLKSTESADEEAKTQELFKAFRGILNKLTPQKYSKLLDEVKKLNIDTEHRLKGILDLIFDKAVDEPAFCLQYANLCKHLATLKVVKVDENGAEKQVKFSPLLLTRCQKEFESKMYEGIDIEGKQKIIDETTDEEKKKLLLAELDEEKRRARKRSLGNIKLIGELYKLNMLTGNIMMSCVEKLLRDGEEESLECLCALLRTIGEKLEEDTKKYEQKHNLRTSIMAPYFSTLSDFVEQKKTSARVRFMIQDILDMRANNWQARKIQDENKPKTIDEIHSEAQEEEKKKMLELQQHSQKRQESLKKGGDWKNKNTQTVNMLKNLKNSSTTEQLQFGPGHAFANSWSQGARGGSQQKESIRLPSNESDRKGQRDSSKGQSRSQNLPQTDTMRNIIPSQDSSDQWVKKPVGRNNPPFASDYAVKQPRGSRNSSMEKGSAPSSRGSSIKRESLKKEAESESKSSTFLYSHLIEFIP
ncbi:eukaryotic translation initiation factor 4 gamma 3-like protein [Dinothrombium tinctorium]|uniref:Eukaryotic translation initiation factor 4 gamma 3-like protein n=1 Tax=Dinothrombium tinctorium TaxID=1965070 RepID=A0A3S3RQU2_9ACAR|nr:eukaryotic translation initiation factor 4 gamma 3-like protein [Dinothrombium tinctorium]RWS06420.1 eukaryotic translation initiation factor 4 gamma 3-like protein [Dinothrombium tinctorium]